MRKLVRFVTLFLLMMALLVPSVQADGTYTFTSLSDGTVAITGYNGSDTTLNIPATLSGHKVTAIAQSAFSYNNDIVHVVIPNGVTRIENNAFFGCENLVTVELPSTLLHIGDWAFRENHALKNITLPEGLRSLGYEAFALCYKIPSIQLPSALTIIGDNPFNRCYDTVVTVAEGNTALHMDEMGVLYSVTDQRLVYCPYTLQDHYTVQDGTRTIGKRAFSGCSISSISLPSSLRVIEAWAFNYVSLQAIDIPEGVTTLEDGAFIASPVLSVISLPASLTNIDKDAFDSLPDDLLLIVPSGSCAAQYAKSHGLAYTLK